MAVNVKIVTEQMITTMITLSDLFGNYNVSTRYSTFHHSIDTGSLALGSCHCGGYVYYNIVCRAPAAGGSLP